MINLKAKARLEAAQRMALPLLATQALADYAALIVAQAVDHRPELQRLRAEVARLEAALERAKAADQRRKARGAKAPCQGCGVPMRKSSAQRGGTCQTCYEGRQSASHKAVMDAVAKINADPDRPPSVMGCWNIVAAQLGQKFGAARSLGERCGAVVSPRPLRLTECRCGKPVFEKVAREPVCRTCEQRARRQRVNVNP